MMMLTWLLQFADQTVEDTDSDNVRLRKRILALAALIAPGFLFFIGVLYLIFDEPLAAVTYSGFALYIWANLVIYLKWHRNYMTLMWMVSLPALPLHLITALSLGNFINSGGIVLWGLAYPVVTGLIFLPLRQVMWFFLAFILNLTITTLLQPQLRQTVNIPLLVVSLIFIINLTGIALFIMLVLAYFIHQRDVAFQMLGAEQQKSENLLLNILPAEIARILKDDDRTIAEHFDTTSILFADVVNFTPMSALMSPVELVNLLNEIFSYFDSLVERYGLEKIKTIGDCYMVASGVPRPRADHAQVLTRMALDIQTYTAGREFNGHKLNFRIGINSGPVVAGVIGRKKFIYDLWGDAVNVASRMESHGVGGTVQITQATYEYLQNEFNCEPRGKVHIKGKGEMDVWTVTGEKQREVS